MYSSINLILLTIFTFNWTLAVYVDARNAHLNLSQERLTQNGGKYTNYVVGADLVKLI